MTSGCLTPRIHELSAPSRRLNSGIDRALIVLEQAASAPGERSLVSPAGVPVFYTDESSSFDRVAPIDADADRTPDVVEQVVQGLGLARELLIERLHLEEPQGVEVVLAELGAGLEGYLVERDGRMTIVLDGSSGGDPAQMVQAAAHQYAHAVARAAGPRLGPEWSEALATWVGVELAPRVAAPTAAILSARVERLAAGLETRDPELAAGNALWLAFLAEAYGPATVAVTVQELAQGGPVDEALGRGLTRVGRGSLAASFREFQLWTVLTGPRADRQHFKFAPRLAGPRFASEADGLPALSVQSDPPVAPWGAAQVRIVPDSPEGGLGLRFEGESAARWQADLLLIARGGTMRRVVLDMGPDGSAEAKVPLEGLVELLLLVRNLGSDDGAPHRYSYTAHRERGFPVEIVAFEAVPRGDAVDLAWDTTLEQELVGFNLLRSREDGGAEVLATPVWIPAVGLPDETTSYQFVDRGIEPGVTYVYRLEAITTLGLTSYSAPVIARRHETD